MRRTRPRYRFGARPAIVTRMATDDARAALLLREVAEIWNADPVAAEARLAAEIAGSPALGSAARSRLHARLGQLRIFLGRIDDALDVLYEAPARAEDGYVELQIASALVWRGDADALAEASDARRAPPTWRGVTGTDRSRSARCASGARSPWPSVAPGTRSRRSARRWA